MFMDRNFGVRLRGKNKEKKEVSKNQSF